MLLVMELHGNMTVYVSYESWHRAQTLLFKYHISACASDAIPYEAQDSQACKGYAACQ